MKGKHVVHSRKSDHWATPKELINEFMKKGYFDPCPLNHDTDLWDGLKEDWTEKVFVNPPYSDIKSWIVKSFEEFNKGNSKEIVLFIPARTSNKWFHEYLYMKDNVAIEFVKGRVKFEGAKDYAPFPSMFVTIKDLT